MAFAQSARNLLLATALAASTLPSSPVLAADTVLQSAYEAGPCGEIKVLNRIIKNFRHQVTHVPNLPQVDIVDFQRIHEHRYEPSGEDSPIARRYCGATAALSSGSNRDIWYLIEEDQGFAGIIGDNVEFCVAGFDRWYVYNTPNCRVLR